jgi:hypothetical protein
VVWEGRSREALPYPDVGRRGERIDVVGTVIRQWCDAIHIIISRCRGVIHIIAD